MRPIARLPRITGAAVMLFVGTACDSNPMAPYPEGIHPGLFKAGGMEAEFEVPAEAPAGRTVVITIRTVGGGCIKAGNTKVTTSERTVDVRVYDVYPPTGAVCTADIRFVPRFVDIPTGAAGILTLRLHGSVVVDEGTGTAHRENIALDKTIVVR